MVQIKRVSYLFLLSADPYTSNEKGIPGISEENLKLIQIAQKLENKAREIMNHRLNELIAETEVVCANLKDGCALTEHDIGGLKGKDCRQMCK